MREGCALKYLDRWWWMLVIPGAMAAYRILFLALLSRLTLAEDEAQYWEWSRFLDWGYFTKPGGVAWSIWASTSIFGNSEFAVRLPAMLAGFIGSVAVGLLALDMFRDRRIAALSSAAYLAVPAFAVLGFFMTIDGPVMAAWAVAAWAGHRAMVCRDRRGWILLGLAIAVGVQFKPTMLLVIPGVLLFSLYPRRAHKAPDTPATPPADAQQSHTTAITIALLIVLVGFVPTLIYNAQHGWVQIAHLLDHLGIQLHEAADSQSQLRASWKPSWTLEYPIIQLATGGPVAVLGIIAAIKLFVRTKADTSFTPPEHSTRQSVLWCVCLAVPLLVFYLAVSFFTRVEANWPIAAWVTACPLAAWAALEGFRVNDRGLKFGVWFSVVLGVLIPAVLLTTPLLHGRQIGQISIPTHRIIGFAAAASAVDQALAVLRTSSGSEPEADPFVMAVSYGRTAQLAFKLAGNPTVYCTARYTPGGSGRQYDLWAHTDLENPAIQRKLQSRSAVTMGKDAAYWERAFDTVALFKEVNLEPGKTMPTFLCSGYRGFDRE